MVGAQGLICCDLEGTLLDSSKQVVPEVREALSEARSRGFVVAIDSGRHPFKVFELMDGLGLPRTCTCLSGAATFVERAIKTSSSQIMSMPVQPKEYAQP